MESEDYRSALVAGVIPGQLQLPGGVVGRQRLVRIAQKQLLHMAERRPDWLMFCLLHAPLALASPQYLGYRSSKDDRRVEFVRRVRADSPLLLVAVKFLDAQSEAWISTAHPMEMKYLTRRLRARTMQVVSRGL